jgi:hypothetical protein
MSAAAVLVLVLLLVVLVALWLASEVAFSSFRRAKLLEQPAGDAADLRPGLGKVRGTAVARAKVLTAPLSGRQCVYYRLRVEEYRPKVVRKARPGKDPVTTHLVGVVHGQFVEGWTNQRSTWVWKSLVDESRGTLAGVQDKTGEAEVDLAEASVTGAAEVRVEPDEHYGMPTAVQMLLRKKYNIDILDRLDRRRKLRVIEEAIEEGAKLTAAGRVRVEEGKAVFAPRALVVEKGVKAAASALRTRAVLLAVLSGGLAVVAVGLCVALALLV